jgi:hypothetical protein
MFDATKSALIHIGPTPINLLATITEQCCAQGWIRDQILFAGMGVVTTSPILPTGQPVQVPLYYILFFREIVPGEDWQPPKITIAGREIGGFNG